MFDIARMYSKALSLEVAGPFSGYRSGSRAAARAVSPGYFGAQLCSYLLGLLYLGVFCVMFVYAARSRSAVAWGKERHAVCERAGVPRPTER